MYALSHIQIWPDRKITNSSGKNAFEGMRGGGALFWPALCSCRWATATNNTSHKM